MTLITVQPCQSLFLLLLPRTSSSEFYSIVLRTTQQSVVYYTLFGMIICFLFHRVARYRHLAMFLDSSCSLSTSLFYFLSSGNHSLSPQSTLMCLSFVPVSHYFNDVLAFTPLPYVFGFHAASKVKFQNKNLISSLLEVFHRHSYLLPQTSRSLLF